MSHRILRRGGLALALAAMALGLACVARAPQPAAPTARDATEFVNAAEARLLDLGTRLARAQWVAANFITDDTETLSAQANEQFIAAVTEAAKAATAYDGLSLPDDVRRKLLLLKLSLPMPAPSNAAELGELTRIATSLSGDYGKGRYCPPGKECLSLQDIEQTLRVSRDPAQLKDVWLGWRQVSVPMRDRYTRFVALSNKGAREMGFPDVGAMWRSGYDMPPDAFAAEADRLWQQVRPLYASLHAYVRARLIQKYGDAARRPDGRIPAHLLGNLWAQQWGNVYDLVAPPGQERSLDLTSVLVSRKVDWKGMVKYGEGFFTSLGFAPLPQTFWERSLFVKPRDREVICHASAWSMDFKDDIRLKMCIEPNAEDFVTVHHELGHNFYQRAYNAQSVLFQNAANDGFHEAVGDAIALSVTPEYLARVGLIDTVPSADADIPLLMRQALDKVAFLPFGLLVDQWRWKVFAGEVTPENYNAAWWALVEQYQGVAAPGPRSESDFDPGSKFHVADNTPYMRYFLAHILQFQFLRALCREAGVTGPLHRCSIYGNTGAGRKLEAMLAMGQSRPWPEALAALSGETQMDATAILDYFAPLKAWLDDENRKMGVTPGWEAPK